MARLDLEKVSRRFGGVAAVSDVSFSASPGVITGLIGPNGAGKTTLVNMIAGSLAVDSGRVIFNGSEITEAHMTAIARSGIGRTFQNIRLLGELSVLDNIIMGFHRTERSTGIECLFGLPAARRERREVLDRARALLERFGMMRFADYPASEVSYGYQRKVEIMRAIAAEPKLLLLDEPVAGMNDVEATELGNVFLNLARSGVTILLIEHNMRFVRSICSALNVLNSGRLIASGPTNEVVRDRDVIAAYLGA